MTSPAATHQTYRKRFLVLAVENSRNSKIGITSATYVTQASCNPTCGLMNNGCYAEHGMVGMVTRQLNANAKAANVTPSQIAQQEAAGIDTLTGAHPLRLHVVGECRTNAAATYLARAATRYIKRGGQIVWTYTHEWRAVHRASWGPIKVLASCDSPSDVPSAHARGYATAIGVNTLEHPSASPYDYHGVKVMPCPHQTRGINCVKCRLCWNPERLRRDGLTIGFAVHGSGWKKAQKTFQGESA